MLTIASVLGLVVLVSSGALACEGSLSVDALGLRGTGAVGIVLAASALVDI